MLTSPAASLVLATKVIFLLVTTSIALFKACKVYGILAKLQKKKTTRIKSEESSKKTSGLSDYLLHYLFIF